MSALLDTTIQKKSIMNGDEMLTYAYSKIKSRRGNTLKALTQKQQKDYCNAIEAIMKDSQQVQKIQKSLEEQIADKVGKDVPKAILDKVSGRAYPAQYKTDVKINDRIISQLEESAQIIEEDGVTNAASLDSLKKNIKSLRNALSEEKKKGLLFIQNETIIGNINKILTSLNYGIVASALFQGTFFEEVVATAAKEIIKDAEEIADNEIEQMVARVGDIREKAVFKGLGIQLGKSGNYVWKKVLDTPRDSTAMIKSEIKFYSQGKIDIKISFNNTQKDIGISAKNMKNISAIDIETDTNMFTILSNETGKYQKSYVWTMWEADDNNSLYKERRNALLSFQALAAYKALTGAKLGRNPASIFIIWDNKNQKPYVFNMANIIDKSFNNENSRQFKKYFRFSPAKENEYLLKASENNDHPLTMIPKLLQVSSKKKLSIMFNAKAYLNSLNQK